MKVLVIFILLNSILNYYSNLYGNNYMRNFNFRNKNINRKLFFGKIVKGVKNFFGGSDKKKRDPNYCNYKCRLKKKRRQLNYVNTMDSVKETISDLKYDVNKNYNSIIMALKNLNQHVNEFIN